ncbi:hypothetical protein, partial [Klebsiella pneumoniae]|uniref:hypothetical protein n=1 Tax=Klebsiella pneumoniae TaxID=573 RepID=UPI001954444D
MPAIHVFRPVAVLSGQFVVRPDGQDEAAAGARHPRWPVLWPIASYLTGTKLFILPGFNRPMG